MFNDFAVQLVHYLCVENLMPDLMLAQDIIGSLLIGVLMLSGIIAVANFLETVADLFRYRTFFLLTDLRRLLITLFITTLIWICAGKRIFDIPTYSNQENLVELFEKNKAPGIFAFIQQELNSFKNELKCRLKSMPSSDDQYKTTVGIISMLNNTRERPDYLLCLALINNGVTVKTLEEIGTAHNRRGLHLGFALYHNLLENKREMKGEVSGLFCQNNSNVADSIFIYHPNNIYNYFAGCYWIRHVIMHEISHYLTSPFNSKRLEWFVEGIAEYCTAISETPLRGSLLRTYRKYTKDVGLKFGNKLDTAFKIQFSNESGSYQAIED